jgi:hypothetical protein
MAGGGRKALLPNYSIEGELYLRLLFERDVDGVEMNGNGRWRGLTISFD